MFGQGNGRSTGLDQWPKLIKFRNLQNFASDGRRIAQDQLSGFPGNVLPQNTNQFQQAGSEERCLGQIHDQFRKPNLATFLSVSTQNPQASSALHSPSMGYRDHLK